MNLELPSQKKTIKSRPVQKNQILELKVEDIAFGGSGIAHLNDYVIFIGNEAVPGQTVKTQITRVKQSFAEAKICEIVKPSDIEIPAPCPYFHHCGGCKHQNIPYSEQINYLHRQVQNIYRHLGQFEQVEVNPPIPAENIFRYRNKMEFAFSNRRWRLASEDPTKPDNFALGLRVPGNFMKAIDIEDCLIAPEETAKVLKIVRTFALKNNLSAYDTKTHSGFLRHLVIRKGKRTDQLMINIVTQTDLSKVLKPLIQKLREQIPNLTSVVNMVTSAISGTTIGEKTNFLFGERYIEEKLGDLTLKVSPASFFQTNTEMAEKIYQTIRSSAKIKKTSIIWDLYCGIGSISLFIARDAKLVVGFEIIPEAVRDAIENADKNQIENVRFIEGDLDILFRKQPELLHELPTPDILIIDPPRNGMHPKLIDDVRKLNPETIVYVSCNPSTQVRDLKAINAENQYCIGYVQPVDLFPHTPHIEVVTRLRRH